MPSGLRQRSTIVQVVVGLRRKKGYPASEGTGDMSGGT